MLRSRAARGPTQSNEFFAVLVLPCMMIRSHFSYMTFFSTVPAPCIKEKNLGEKKIEKSENPVSHLGPVNSLTAQIFSAILNSAREKKPAGGQPKFPPLYIYSSVLVTLNPIHSQHQTDGCRGGRRLPLVSGLPPLVSSLPPRLVVQELHFYSKAACSSCCPLYRYVAPSILTASRALVYCSVFIGTVVQAYNNSISI
jgi:hypothetical protein